MLKLWRKYYQGTDQYKIEKIYNTSGTLIEEYEYRENGTIAKKIDYKNKITYTYYESSNIQSINWWVEDKTREYYDEN